MSCCSLIDRLDDERAGICNLECEITVGRKTPAGGYGCGTEAEHALVEGNLVGSDAEEKTVADL